MKNINEDSPDIPLVLSLHGIRTTGKWQDDLSEALESRGFRHRPLNFGFFHALWLLLPWARKKKIEWFRREYDAKVGDSKIRPSIIAHSFGSYIVAGALEKYDLVVFDRIIFCGSIVRRDYPWSEIIEGGQVNFVLNEAGKKDFWAGIIEWVVVDAGSSGVHGFRDLAHQRVLQIQHDEHEHSDYFFRRNYLQRWIPFLEGRLLPEIRPRPSREINWKFMVVFSLIISALVWVVWFSDFKSRGIFLSERSIIMVPIDKGHSGSSTVGRSASKHDHNVLSPNATEATNEMNGASVELSGASHVQEPVVEKKAVNEVEGENESADTATQAGDSHRVLNVPAAAPTSGFASPQVDARTSKVTQSLAATSTAAAIKARNYDQCFDKCKDTDHSCKLEKDYSERAQKWLDKSIQYPETSAWGNYQRYDGLSQKWGADCLDDCDRKCQ